MLLAPKPGAVGWEDRYITSQELNAFLKRIFATGGRPIAGRKITTHSMKATGLSWCSKPGISQEHRAILARHATSVQGAAVLYSRDLLSSALRSFVRVLESIKGQTFDPDKSRSGMITPARATLAGAPATPLPPGASAVGATVAGGMQAGATCAERPLGEQSVDKQVHVEQQQDLLMAGYEAYSPGTPVDSPAIKVEYEWPEADWDDAVIDLEEQHDLLTAWQSGSEEESSGCVYSRSDKHLISKMEKPKVAKPKLELFGESLWQLLFVFVFQTVCLVFLRIVQISFHLILHFTPQVVGGGFPPILVQWTTFSLGERAMVDPSETASASDAALDMFGGHSIELEDFSVGDAVSHDTAKPGISQTTFGRDTFDNLDFARAVDSCFKALESKPVLLPWESRPWRPIFQQNFDYMDDFNMGSIFRPVLPGPVAEHSVQKKIKLSPPVVLSSNFSRAVVKHPEETWMDKRDSELQTGLKRWLTCIMSWNPTEKVVQELQGCATIADGLTLLRDYMGTKAPATLYKRVNSLGILFQHVKLQDFPCTELQLYQALCDMRSAGCKPSRIKGIVEAVTFCRFVFDIGKLQECVNSKRCLGVARGLPSDLPFQAAPLTVLQLTELHRLVRESTDTWDRVFAGAVLFCVYSRSCWTFNMVPSSGWSTLVMTSDTSLAKFLLTKPCMLLLSVSVFGSYVHLQLELLNLTGLDLGWMPEQQ